MKNRIIRTAALILLGLLTLAARPAQAQDGPARVRDRMLRSTAWVVVPDGFATCCLIDHEQRLMLTNFHAVTKHDKVEVVFARFTRGKLIADRDFYLRNREALALPGTVIHRDAKRDLAVIRVDRLPKGALELPLAEESVAVGARVHRLGSPAANGEVWKLSSSTVRNVGQRKMRYSTKQEVDTTVVANDGENRPGDSGAALVNERFELVGVHAAFIFGDKVSAAIDVQVIKAFLKEAGVKRKAPSIRV